MGRLIDADELRSKLLMLECMEDVVEIIDEQPTAYSVEKVVEELEKYADENYESFCIGFNSDDRVEYDAYINAIEIVRGGKKSYGR